MAAPADRAPEEYSAAPLDGIAPEMLPEIPASNYHSMLRCRGMNVTCARLGNRVKRKAAL